MAWNQHDIPTFPSDWDQNNIWAYNPTAIIRPWRQAICEGCFQPFSTQDNTQISCYECRHSHPFGAIGDGCPGPLRDSHSSSSDGSPPSPPEGDGSPSDENSSSEEGSLSGEGSYSEEESEEDSESESSDSSEQSLLSTESTPFTTGNHTSSSSTKRSSSSSDTDDAADDDDMILNIASLEDNDEGTDEDSDEDSDDGSNEDRSEEGDSGKPRRVKWPTNMKERLECDLDELFLHGY